MNRKTYDRVYAACQAGGMNNTDSHDIATDHATRNSRCLIHDCLLTCPRCACAKAGKAGRGESKVRHVSSEVAHLRAVKAWETKRKKALLRASQETGKRV
jgi:hypothetical protein